MAFTIPQTKGESGILVQPVGVSIDDGQTWQYIGLKEQSIRSIYVWQGFLYVGTWEGVWRRSLADIVLTDISRTSSYPVKLSLEQNYPNPFNPSTTIRYALPDRAHVTLTVFNTLGQQLATLVEEVQDAGYHDVRFDASGLTSGVYLYQLRAGGYMATKKLQVIR